MELAKNLFENKLIEDERLPVLSMDFMDYHVNFFAPNYLFFFQIGFVSRTVLIASEASNLSSHNHFSLGTQILSIQMVVGCLFGVM
jgi:hypothetical protein